MSSGTWLANWINERCGFRACIRSRTAIWPGRSSLAGMCKASAWKWWTGRFTTAESLSRGRTEVSRSSQVRVMRGSGPEVPKQRDGDHDDNADCVKAQSHAPLECFDCRMRCLIPRCDGSNCLGYTVQEKGPAGIGLIASAIGLQTRFEVQLDVPHHFYIAQTRQTRSFRRHSWLRLSVGSHIP